MRWFTTIALTVMATCAVTLLPTNSARPDNPPICEKVQVQENSGNGPNYPIKLCDDRPHSIKYLIVDGGPFPEKTTTRTTVVFWVR